MNEDQAQHLLRKYHEGTATPEEKELLEGWLMQYRQHEQSSLSADELNMLKNEVWKGVSHHTSKKAATRLWPRIAAAASILVFLSAGGYLLWRQSPVKPQQVATVRKPDLLPGIQKATLILSNGSRINLASAQTGIIAQQGSTNITKTVDNQIKYNNSGEPVKELAYNTLVTKRGNYYPLTLSDGTVAILDAASSIRYPVNFTGNERRVEITGQVFFQVKHNSKMPFRVSVRGQTIEDLGTEFNINAYDDEPAIKTTLLEGSVRVNNQVTLRPGQQASIHNNSIKVQQADVEQTVAWKNGLFSFKETPIADVMRQLSRWYDVDVEYPAGLPKTVFNGEMHRNTKASQVLDMLSYFKVHFEIVQGSNGKKILVKP